MKNMIKLVVVFALVFSFSSCEDDGLGNVIIGTTLTDSFEVNVPQTLGDTPVSITEINQAISLENVDTQGHLSDVQEIEITSLSFQITAFSGDVEGELVDFQAYVGDQLIFDESNLVPSQSFADHTVYAVETSQLEAMSSVANALLNDQEVMISYSGSAISENADMDFTVAPSIGVRLTVGL